MNDYKMTTVRITQERWESWPAPLQKAYRPWHLDMLKMADGTRVFQMPIKVLKDLQKQEEAHERRETE